jgi:hypothetical protein
MDSGWTISLLSRQGEHEQPVQVLAGEMVDDEAEVARDGQPAK